MARNRNKDTAVTEKVDEMLGSDTEELDELNAGVEETEEVRKPITPADIAEATGADPKAIRGYLRSNFPRPKDMKGKSWDIPAGVAEAVIEHFTASDDEDEELEEVAS
jgi:hypothetical protein